jgi:hypothetical protein
MKRTKQRGRESLFYGRARGVSGERNASKDHFAVREDYITSHEPGLTGVTYHVTLLV